jgi:heme-degrading monooxygenase HmoA
MSVYMSLRVKADAGKLEEYAREHLDQLQRITEHARSHGCIHHTFAQVDGDIVAMDEWETEDGFREFFNSDEDIPQVMQAVGASGEPEVTFYRPMRLGDDF